MIGAHRAVVEYVRCKVLAGHRGPALAARVQAQATRVFAVLEAGMADYPPVDAAAIETRRNTG
jgi:hypothetical protein